MLSCFHLLLLLVSFGISAHGAVFAPNQSPKLIATAALSAGEADTGPNLNRNSDNLDKMLVHPISVQDWSLVCKELCGAGVGGASRAALCADLNNLEKDKESFERELLYKSLGLFKLGKALCNESVFKKFFELFTEKSVSRISGTLKTSARTVNTAEEDNNNPNNIVMSLDAVQTTTPDWNQLCESLCKTGDGGSLCNCDVSPFTYRKSN